MDIYLIRHTKTDTANGLCYGQTNVPLASTFEEEARKLHQKLPEIKQDCIVFCSPLMRCRLLAETFGKSIKTDCRLLELNFGHWENCPFDEIDDEALMNWTTNFVSTPPPNGETFADLCRRVGEFWDELMVKAHDSPIMVVTHAGVIRALFANILQLPPANAFKLRVDPGSIHKLEHINGYTYIHYINR